MDKQDFLATFPNKGILETFSKSKRIELAIHNIVAQVSKTERDPGASSVMEVGWIQIKSDPVRVKIQARNIAKMRVIVEIFIGIC